MDTNQIIEYLKNKNTDKVKFAFADIDGVLRGKVIHLEKFIAGLQSGYGFCDVAFGWDSADALNTDIDATGWHSGFPDQQCFIDISTMRFIPWQNDLPFFLADFSQTDQGAAEVCPRTLLRRLQKKCTDMGFHAEFAQEFEWFNFKETSETIAGKHYRNLNPLSSGMFGYSVLRPSQNSEYYYDLFNELGKFDVPLEGLHTETGPGVYEAAIIHDEVLAAADKAVLLKASVKEIAAKHGLMATFMAKWNEQLPGCSGHIHQSLWDLEKKSNLFFNEEDPDKMSDLVKHYIAGQLYCLPYIMPFYAPTINSYKRLVEAAWAPTTVSWGLDNRTTALRVINQNEKLARLETRIPGSDTNPYLALAASLASGLYGIENRIPLHVPATRGNAYTQGLDKLPENLYDATMIMSKSPLPMELFGSAFINHFSKTRFWECKEQSRYVSDWELKRYFEII
ncbi:MAG: glutamine synthetase family protein [Arcticibacter sp.]